MTCSDLGGLEEDPCHGMQQMQQFWRTEARYTTGIGQICEAQLPKEHEGTYELGSSQHVRSWANHRWHVDFDRLVPTETQDHRFTHGRSGSH